MTKVFVPLDMAAKAMGADKVAAAIAKEAAARGLDVTIVRNGSRGLLWLEPLVEVETPQGRIGYGNVAARDVPSLFDSGFLYGRSAQAVDRQGRGSSLLEAPASRHVQALRDHGSAVACRI